MPFPRAVLAASLLALALPAQGGKANTNANASQTEYDKLVADSEAANRSYAAAMRKLQASDEYKKAAEAKDNDTLKQLSQSVPKVDRKAFAERAMKLSGQFAGDECVPFLIWAANNNGGDKEITKTAVERLMKDHVKSKKLVDLAENGQMIGAMIGRDASDQMLTRLVAENGDPQVRAWAMYWQATQLRGKNATEEDKAKADELLAQASKLAAGSSLADRIAAPAFAKEHLEIGMTVPDIAGEDVDGVKFKLSDYRGKVVVVDFWGFW
jgi:hypothetical protein